MDNFEYKPCINVVVDKIDDPLVKNILAGIEEEGLPYEVSNLKDREILSTTYKASQVSKLGIGVGISNNRVIVQQQKLGENNPIIDTSLNIYEISRARKIGNNAARLYKVMPFKESDSCDLNSLVDNIRLKVIEVLKNHG